MKTFRALNLKSKRQTLVCEWVAGCVVVCADGWMDGWMDRQRYTHTQFMSLLYCHRGLCDYWGSRANMDET